MVAFFYTRHKKIKLGAMTDLAVMGLLLGQCIGRWANFINREAFGAVTDAALADAALWTSATQYIEVHPTFLYESLWNLIGLLLILFVVSKGRRFDGENTWFYFLWYGLGRSWIEGLRTDSLYLFDWTFMGQPIRVSQALSLVMVAVSAVMLFYNIRIKKHTPEDLLVNQVAAAEAGQRPLCGGGPQADRESPAERLAGRSTGGAEPEGGALREDPGPEEERRKAMATRIDGKALAAKVKAQAAAGGGGPCSGGPGLAVILVGDDPGLPGVCHREGEGLRRVRLFEL